MHPKNYENKQTLQGHSCHKKVTSLQINILINFQQRSTLFYKMIYLLDRCSQFRIYKYFEIKALTSQLVVVKTLLDHI